MFSDVVVFHVQIIPVQLAHELVCLFEQSLFIGINQAVFSTMDEYQHKTNKNVCINNTALARNIHTHISICRTNSIRAKQSKRDHQSDKIVPRQKFQIMDP